LEHAAISGLTQCKCQDQAQRGDREGKSESLNASSKASNGK
jgi:hypothetical protein